MHSKVRGPRLYGPILAWLVLMALACQTAQAYPRYRNPATGAGYCSDCHGAFWDATSLKGTVFPSGSKHEMHRSGAYMNTACALCHLDTDGFNPYLGASTGTTNNPGRGCSGCHTQAGLVAHHAINSVTDCLECHLLNPAPPENLKPLYYGTADTRASNPCNGEPLPMANENWSLGDLLGLDNDGNNLYDMADPACGVGGLAVFPEDAFAAVGEVGGPFHPQSITYTLTNAGAIPLDWTSAKGQDWVSVSATQGVLAAGASLVITVGVNTNAWALPAGTYADSVRWAAGEGGNGYVTREVALSVIEVFTTNHPTPLWWLRAVGVTSDFEVAVSTVSVNGYALWESYIAGLNPNDPASQLRLVGAFTPGGAQFVLRWNPVRDRLYTVWASVSLQEGFSRATGAISLPWPIDRFTNAVNPAAPARFYRLEVRKP